jgi:uncharacterized protein (TIRG00374 family)
MTRYVFLAVGSIVLALYFLSKSYLVVFKMNQLERKTWDLFKLNLIGKAANVVIPTAGLSQALVYVADANKRGDSKAKTVSSVLVTYISDYTSIALFLTFSILYLRAVDIVIPHVVITAAIFIVLTVGVYSLAYFAGKESKRLEGFIFYTSTKLENLLYFFTKKPFPVAENANNLYREFRGVNKAILADPKDWLLSIFYASMYHLFSVFSLFFIFTSLGMHPLIRIIIAAYSIGAVFIVISPTPNGIGFVEGGMYLVFTTLEIPATIATTAVMIYRGFSFWIPLIIGAFLYQKQKLKDIFL